MSSDLDLGSDHNAYTHVSLIDLYLHIKFCLNWTKILWMSSETDVETDGQASGWFGEVDLIT